MLNGYVAYDENEAFNNQPGQNSLWTNQPMDNATIGYWLVCTGRKIVLVTKIGIRYTNSYMGFMLPYALPSEYPYPLLIAANVQTLSEQISSSTDRYRMMVNPGYKAVHLRDPGGAWIWFSIWAGVGSETVNVDRITWPYGSV